MFNDGTFVGVMITAVAGLLVAVVRLGWTAKHRAAQTDQARADAEHARAEVIAAQAAARESDATAAHQITEAAAQLVDPLRKEVAAAREVAAAAQSEAASAREETKDVLSRLEEHVRNDLAQKEARTRQNYLHGQWDQKVADRLREAGMDVDDPPPLLEEGAA